MITRILTEDVAPSRPAPPAGELSLRSRGLMIQWDIEDRLSAYLAASVPRQRPEPDSP